MSISDFLEESPQRSRIFVSTHSPLLSSNCVKATELGAGRGLWTEGSTYVLYA